MRFIVCGGRVFRWLAPIYETLDLIKHDGLVIISGMASGADFGGYMWGRENGYPVVEVPANWEKLGKKAGILRNVAMLNEHHPDGVIAFPGGNGTTHMVRIAEKAGVPTWKVDLGRPLQSQAQSFLLSAQSYTRPVQS